MDEAQIKEEVLSFCGWLRETNTLQEGSVQVYGRVMQHFFKTYPKLSSKFISKERIIEYVVRQNKESNETHTRAAIIHFLKYNGFAEQYMKNHPEPGSWDTWVKYNIPVPKRPKIKKRKPNFLPDHTLRLLIRNIDNKVYKDISKLRYHTGIRISEALTIRGEKIEKRVIVNPETGQHTKYVNITVTAKGGRTREVALTLDHAKQALVGYKIVPGFIFIPKRFNQLEVDNEVKFWKRIQSYGRYYNTALDAARIKIGLQDKFSSHDIRRSFAENLRNRGADLFTIKGIMGHQDIRTTVRYFNDSEEESIKNSIKYQGGFNEYKKESA